MLWYDLEIAKAIPQPNEDPIEGIDYCKNWGDQANMGIAVLVAFSEERKSIGVFMNDNREEFRKWVDETNIVMGFNNKRFDDPVLFKNWGIEIPPEKSSDLYLTIKDAAPSGITGSLSLDAILKANFNIGKTEDGAMAPVYYQRGEVGRVINYCIQDVRMLKMLYSRIQKTNSIIDPRTGRIITFK